MSGRRPVLATIYKKCNVCKTTKSFKFHGDRWGMIGWICHKCYNNIISVEKRGIITKNCNTCGSKETTSSIWHRDKWGEKGRVCHTCFNSIVYREQRLFNYIIKRNRPTGLIYNKNKKKV